MKRYLQGNGEGNLKNIHYLRLRPGNEYFLNFMPERSTNGLPKAKAFLYKSRNQNFSIIETYHFLSKYRLMVNQRH